MSYSSEVLADSPLAYWRMGEPSGTTLTDSSGNGRTGTYANVTLGASSLLTSDADTAASFNGTSSKADVTYAAWMQTADFTIEAWILTSATGFRDIATRDNGSSQRTFEFRIDSTTGALNFIKLAGGTTNSVGVTNIRDGVRHHVVATYDGSNIRLYVDGNLDKTSAASGSMAVGTAVLSLGMRRSDFWWSGTLDEVAIYGTALSGARVSAHYAAGVAINLAGERATLAATALDGSALTAIHIAGDAATVAATALNGSPSSGPVVINGETAFVSVAALDGAPQTQVLVGGDLATLSAHANDGALLVGPVPGSVAVVSLTALDGGVAADATTDVSNVFNGRSRDGFASVELDIPDVSPPAPPATRVDKAVALPVPVLVKGRPT